MAASTTAATGTDNSSTDMATFARMTEESNLFTIAGDAFSNASTQNGNMFNLVTSTDTKDAEAFKGTLQNATEITKQA